MNLKLVALRGTYSAVSNLQVVVQKKLNFSTHNCRTFLIRKLRQFCSERSGKAVSECKQFQSSENLPLNISSSHLLPIKFRFTGHLNQHLKFQLVLPPRQVGGASLNFGRRTFLGPFLGATYSSVLDINISSTELYIPYTPPFSLLPFYSPTPCLALWIPYQPRLSVRQ